MTILITGENGYIATNLKKLFTTPPREKSFLLARLVDTVSLRSGTPENLDGYDTVIHCAGAVHGNTRKDSEIYRINRDLTLELAEKAKKSGVGHFVFLSSMAVYGAMDRIGESVVIDSSTACLPKSAYGKSKLAAEEGLNGLRDENFRVAVLRPPMVYGPGCPGNYGKLVRFATTFPIFPYVENQRSMIHIDRLCRFILEICIKKSDGIFLPQDEEYKCTSLLVRNIAEDNGKKIYLSPALGKIIKIMDIPATRKIFGNLVYDR